MERYQYGPAIGERSIRVLVLHPAAEHAAELTCNLELHHLGVLRRDQPEYEPVSYAWGMHDLSHTLQCGPLFIPITAVVDTMLRHLRLSDQPRRLWIDAICMNQQDQDEKAAQVQSMAMIYRRRPVIVWLGADEHQDDAETEHCTLELIARRYPTPQMADFLKDPVNCSALTAFLLRPWFHRRWVLQEIAFSEGGSVMCGSQQVPLDDLMIRLQLIRHYDAEHRWPMLESLKKVFQINFQHFGRRLYAEDSAILAGAAPVSRNLLKLLDYFHEYKCKDDRDRVYALSGLALMVDTPISGIRTRIDQRQAGGVGIDYRESAPALYCRVAEALLLGGSPVSRDILHYAAAHRQASEVPESERNVPTWVPDWRQPRRCWPLLTTGNASGGTRIDEAGISTLRINNSTHGLPCLRIRGIKWGVITSVHPEYMLFDPVATMHPSTKPFDDTGQRITAVRSWMRGMMHGHGDPGFDDELETEQAQESSFPVEIAIALKGRFGKGKAARPHNVYIDKSIDAILRGRSIALTVGANMALVPDDSKAGDLVVVFPGFNTPFILRQVLKETKDPSITGVVGSFHLVGDAWVADVMMGEGLTDMKGLTEFILS